MILPTHGLRTAGRNHRDWRSGLPAGNCSYRRCARSRAGRLRFSRASFKHSDLDLILAANRGIHYVGALRKFRLCLDQRSLPLPSILKVLHEDDEVRIPHRNFRAHRPYPQRLNRQLLTDFGRAHIRFEIKSEASLRHEAAGLQSRAGANNDLCFALARRNFRRYTAGTVAGNFGF